MSENTLHSVPPAPRRTRRALIIASVVALGATGAAVATHAGGHGFRHGHGMGFFGGPMDPADAERRAEKMIKHFAVEIDATAEQQAKLTELAKVLAKDVLPMRDKMRDVRKQAVDLLTAPTVDRAAIEKLRADQIATADQLSKRVTEALARAAEVLTPEQRKSLAERVDRFRDGGGRGRGWGHGWGHGWHRG